MTLPKLDGSTLIPAGVVIAIAISLVTFTNTVATDRAEFKAELKSQQEKIVEDRAKVDDHDRRLRASEDFMLRATDSLKRIERKLGTETQ